MLGAILVGVAIVAKRLTAQRRASEFRLKLQYRMGDSNAVLVDKVNIYSYYSLQISAPDHAICTVLSIIFDDPVDYFGLSVNFSGGAIRYEIKHRSDREVFIVFVGEIGDGLIDVAPVH